MSEETEAATCERVGDLEPRGSTLIEGLPGHGLVASIAVDQITSHLGLEHHGNIYSRDFPPVVTFEDGLVQDLVRIYAGEDPPVLTLQSDLALPQSAFEPLSKCVLSDLADEYTRAIFLAGAPAESEEQLGEVRGIATTPALKEDLADANVPIAEEHGVVGGVTGALVRECYREGIPATLLVVRAHPRLPDPGAARSVIENALEPLVEFDIDTAPLEEHAEEIRQQMHQIAQQYAESAEASADTEPRAMGMYQ